MKTIVVTGGAGFIGSNFIFYMRKKHPNYRIACIDSLTYAGNIETLKGIPRDNTFVFYKADICDKNTKVLSRGMPLRVSILPAYVRLSIHAIL